MNIVTKFNNLISKLSQSFKRFPIAILFTISMVAVLVFTNHIDYSSEKLRDMYTRIAMALALGIPLSLSLHLFFEEKKDISRLIKVSLYGIIPVLLFFYYLLFLKELNTVATMRYAAFVLSSCLLFSFTSCLNKKESYEQYVIKLFSRFIVTYLYSLVLYLGLLAILTTINLLFKIEIPGALFGDIAIVVYVFFAPVFFLGDIPKKDEDFNLQHYPKVLSILLQYIILPLLSIYTIILYIYFGKIVITRDLPSGTISNLVLWYSIISTIILFSIYPLRKVNQWVKFFINIFPKAIIPLLCMMFISMFVRINAYGITESRYFVLIAGIWVSSVMMYYAFKKNVINIFLAISLAIIAFVSVVGPLSAFSVSKSSQNNRFEEIVKKYDMMDQNGNIKKIKKEITKIDQKEISNIISYFDDSHSLSDIKCLPENFKLSNIDDIFGFNVSIEDGSFISKENYFNHYLKESWKFVDIKEYDYFVEYKIGYSESSFPQAKSNKELNDKSGQNDYNITYDNIEKEIIIKNKQEIVYKNDLESVIREIHKKNSGDTELDRVAMNFKEENEKAKVEFMFVNINGTENEYTEEIIIEGAEMYILIKIK